MMFILLRAPINILMGFFWCIGYCLLQPDREWGQEPLYLRRVCEEPGTISTNQHNELGRGCLPWNCQLPGKLFQSAKDFQGGVIFPCGRGATLLLWHRAFELSEATRREWRNRTANKGPRVTAVWRNLWPIILEPKWITICGKEINTAKDCFKDISGKIAKVQYFV